MYKLVDICIELSYGFKSLKSLYEQLNNKTSYRIIENLRKKLH